jgi:uncharacterized protein (TIGR00251 family)
MVDAAGWCTYDPKTGRIVLTVHVQPNARSSAIAGMYGDALKIRIAAPAVDNKANAALLEFVCDRLGLGAAQVAIRHGARGRRKQVEIAAGPGFLPNVLRRLTSP